MTTKQHQSNCCQAPVKIVGDSFGEGTMHWECEKCGQSCNDTYYDLTTPMTPTTVRDLNKYILRADTEKNEWTFSGEIWNAINELLEDREQRAREEAITSYAELLKNEFVIASHPAPWGVNETIDATTKLFLSSPRRLSK